MILICLSMRGMPVIETLENRHLTPRREIVQRNVAKNTLVWAMVGFVSAAGLTCARRSGTRQGKAGTGGKSGKKPFVPPVELKVVHYGPAGEARNVASVVAVFNQPVVT